MANPEVVIPLLEGVCGSLANGTEAVALFRDFCKQTMLATKHKDQTDWVFTCIQDIDETSAATATAPESGAVLYGMLIGYVNATGTDEAQVAVCDDSDGTIGAFAAGDTRVTDDPQIQVKLKAVATEGTEEFFPYNFARGIPFASYMSFVADGEDGTNPATDDIRAWVLYRTGTSRLL